MTQRTHRRRFLGDLASLAPFVFLSRTHAAETDAPSTPVARDFPLVDFHVHLDNSTIDKALALPQARNVRFGIVEHAGTKENQYPTVLSSDTELKTWLATLAGKPVYRGVQAEWTDWMSCFSKPALAQLDYILTDAMTFPAPDGQRVKLWEGNALERVGLTDPDKFMDRYVDWHVQILSREPVDILANTTWLPQPLAHDYDRLWTPRRMQNVIDAAVKYDVALEISASYKLPRLPFLKLAKAAHARFTLGSNGRYPNMGKLDYGVEMATALGLKRGDFFTPAPEGRKAVQRRRRS
jgi:histidinol phosphatase-like PHP family hydrolase